MANAFIASVPRKEVSEIRGFFMRHETGSDVGFSWDQNDARYPVDQWERIPAIAASLANLPVDLDFEMCKMRAMHEFLQWNRALPAPLVEVTKEYGVASKLLDLARLAGLLVRPGSKTSAGLLDEARRAIVALLDALKGIQHVESTGIFGQQVLSKIEAANRDDELSATPLVTADASEGADARLVCKVAREAGTPISVQTARAILEALTSKAPPGNSAAPQPKED
jgi:hypothetical protein